MLLVVELEAGCIKAVDDDDVAEEVEGLKMLLFVVLVPRVQIVPVLLELLVRVVVEQTLVDVEQAFAFALLLELEAFGFTFTLVLEDEDEVVLFLVVEVEEVEALLVTTPNSTQPSSSTAPSLSFLE